MKINQYNYSFLLFFLILITKFSFSNQITILATGELHGRIASCDCPDDPGGGLAGISTIINQQRKEGPVLAVDAGGFSSGGIYDLYTAGYKADSVKSSVMIEAMGISNYDAVGIGDEELQFDPKWLNNISKQYNVSLLSANILKKDSTFWFSSHKILKKGKIKFLITSLVTQEQISNVNKEVIIIDPLIALNKLLKSVNEQWDILLILSHMGEGNSKVIYEKQNKFRTIVVNAHRKFSQEAGYYNGNTLLQFGFQGKMISKMSVREKDLLLTKPEWVNNDEHVEQDIVVKDLANSFEQFLRNVQKEVYDLYIMSQCPYGLPVLNDINNYLSKQFIQNDLNIWFIGDVDSLGELRSLHGQEEISEELKWLAIKEEYKEYWIIFLSMVSSGEFTVDDAIKELDIDTNKLNMWIKKYGITTLSMHYNRSNRLNIDASPTLFLNNQPFKGEITSSFIRARQCSEYVEKKLSCDSLPECFIDSDCRKDGFIGKCQRNINNWGECSYKKANSFDFTIITSNEIIFKVDDDMINTTREMFPGANIKRIDIGNDSAAHFLNKYGIDAIPFAIFSEDIKKSENYNLIKEGLDFKDNAFTFKKEYVEGSYLYKRIEKKGKVELFINFEHMNNYMLGLIDKLISSCKKNDLFIYPIIIDSLSPNSRSLIYLSKYKNFERLLNYSFAGDNSLDSMKWNEEVAMFYNNYMKLYNEIANENSFVFFLNNKEVVIPHHNMEVDAVVKKIVSIVK